MELNETVDLMLSKNFADRLIAEYEQLVIRMKKIDDALADETYSEKYGEENAKLLKEQYRYMSQYEDVLYRRAQNCDIKLPSWEDIGYAE